MRVPAGTAIPVEARANAQIRTMVAGLGDSQPSKKPRQLQMLRDGILSRTANTAIHSPSWSLS